MKVEKLLELIKDCPKDSEVFVQVGEFGSLIEPLFITEDNGRQVPGKNIVVIEC